MKKLFVVCLALMLLLAGCGKTTSSVSASEDDTSASAAETVVKDTLTVVPYFVTESFDPYTADMDNIVILQLFDFLFQRDDDGDLQPALATGWEDSEDGMDTTITLREDVSFSDGTPVNADAVTFCFEIGLESWNQSGGLYYFDSVEKVDDYTVVFHKLAPYTNTAAILADYMPLVSPTAYQADPEGFGTNPVGTGAYSLSRFDSATGYVYLTAREGYYQGNAAIQNVVVQVPLESSVALVALENGEVDLVENPMSNSDLQIAESEGIVVERSTGWSTKSVFLFGEPFVSDKDLCMAVTYAINKENAAIANGELEISVAENLFAPRLLGDLTGTVPAYQYDPEKAAEYLEKSGYSGETLYIDVTEDASKVATSIQADLQAVGIQAEINQLDANTFSDLFAKSDIHMTIMDSGTADFGVEDMLSAYCGGGYYQEVGLLSSTEEMDALMANVMAASSQEARRDDLVQLMGLFQDNGDVVPLYDSVLTYAHSADLKGCEAIWGATTQMQLWKCSY